MELECETAFNWLRNNKLIVNLDKFQIVLLHKLGYDNIEVKIRKKRLKSTSRVKLLGVHIDNKPNFNHHINKVCKWARNQLNTLTWLKPFIGLKKTEVLLNSLYTHVLTTARLYGCYHIKSD